MNSTRWVVFFPGRDAWSAADIIKKRDQHKGLGTLAIFEHTRYWVEYPARTTAKANAGSARLAAGLHYSTAPH